MSAPGYSHLPTRLEDSRMYNFKSWNGTLTDMAEKQDVDMGVDLASIRE